MLRIHQLDLAAALALSCLGSASAAAPLFEGRLFNGTPSTTCTVSGEFKCTSFYNPTLGIAILNNWDIGTGSWSATAAAGSAPALAASEGFAASGLTGCVLPTGDGNVAAGAQTGTCRFGPKPVRVSRASAVSSTACSPKATGPVRSSRRIRVTRGTSPPPTAASIAAARAIS